MWKRPLKDTVILSYDNKFSFLLKIYHELNFHLLQANCSILLVTVYRLQSTDYKFFKLGMSKKVFTIKLKSGVVLRTNSSDRLKSEAKVITASPDAKVVPVMSKAEALSQKQKLSDYVTAVSASRAASNASMKRHIVHALIHSLNHNSNQSLVQAKYNKFMGF